VFLLVPFCQCHQQQWYAFTPFPENLQYVLLLIDSATNSKNDSLFTFTFLQVVKFLVERNSNNALHVQVTIGTLIFQVSFLLSFKD
jgi:hypothetical protein